MNENEDWREVKDFPHLLISRSGKVKTKPRMIEMGRAMKPALRKERILKQHKNFRGYLKVNVQAGDAKGTYFVHRFVAMAFCENKDNKPFVNHINGNKLDNRPENLEWVTNLENIQHAFANGLCSAAGGPGKKRRPKKKKINAQ